MPPTNPFATLRRGTDDSVYEPQTTKKEKGEAREATPPAESALGFFVAEIARWEDDGGRVRPKA